MQLVPDTASQASLRLKLVVNGSFPADDLLIAGNR